MSLMQVGRALWQCLVMTMAPPPHPPSWRKLAFCKHATPAERTVLRLNEFVRLEERIFENASLQNLWLFQQFQLTIELRPTCLNDTDKSNQMVETILAMSN